MEQLIARAEKASAKEKELNKAVIAAKAKHAAEPDDKALLAAYDEAKTSYKAAYQVALAAKMELKKSGYVPPKNTGKAKVSEAEGEKWTCAACNITIALGKDGYNRKAHEEGKKHRKNVERGGAGAEPTPKKIKGVEGKEHLMWTCKLCHVTIASSAREPHLEGKKHAELKGLREKFVANSKLGDWLCKCGQHNFSSKSKCVKAKCGLSKQAGDTLTPTGTKPNKAKAPKDDAAGAAKDSPRSKKSSEAGPLDSGTPRKNSKRKTGSKPEASSFWLQADDGEDADGAATPKKKRKAKEADLPSSEPAKEKGEKKAKKEKRTKGEVAATDVNPENDAAKPEKQKKAKKEKKEKKSKE